MEARNLYQMLERVATADPEAVAFRHKRDGRWVDVSWRRNRDTVRRLARGLMAIGVGPGDRVCVLGATSLQWVQADTATVQCGGVTVGIYPSNLGPDCGFIIRHSEAAVIFVDGPAQMDKIRAVRGDLPGLRHIVVFEGPSSPREGVIAWDELLERGAEVPDDRLSKIGEAIEPDDLAALVYTSGTTGEPKGAMITHRNLLFVTWSAAESLSIARGYTTLMFLPLAHIFARMIVYLCMARGITVAFAEEIATVPQDLRETRPDFIITVPRVLEKVSEKIHGSAREAGGIKQRLFDWALGVGRRVSKLRLRHGRVPFLLRLRHALATKLVLQKVQDAFGGRMRYAISGGAPLNPTTGEFFHACGVTILQGIGMTENTSFTNVNRLDNIKFDTVGPPGPGIELRLADDGEILFRGDNNMKGYFKNPAATAESLDADGWLHTGDIGEIDEDGHLKITDRKKDLIITSGGKNVAPQRVEKALANSPYISHVVAYGDRRKYITALLALDPEQMRIWARTNGLAGAGPEELARDEQVQALIADEVAAQNRSLASFESVKSFRILPGELTIEDGDLTPTLKVKRRVVVDKYRALIDEMYA